MPEIAEVARIVHFLRIHLVGKKIANAWAIDDGNVFGKVGTTGAAVQAALKGNKVVSAGSQGKYFWITLEKQPHLVMHFGMTGWVHIKQDMTAYTNYYKKMGDTTYEQWPPKFWKFHLKTDGPDPVEIAFTDARRFGRVRLVDCPGADIRKHSPLVENGPDPVVDKDRFTLDYFSGKMKSRHVPIKALLLDQTFISGIGNWVADETLYQAKAHPEQYCNEFDDDEIKSIYEAINYVCGLSIDKLGDSDQFPDHWLFNHRWGKGDKGPSKLPNGEKLDFITVGGRTSCYAPGVQKKTGGKAGRVKTEVKSEDDAPEPKESKKSVKKTVKKTVVKKEEEDEEDKKPISKKRRAPMDQSPVENKKGKTQAKPAATTGRRQSARLRD